jgi:uncharacterized membrane protein YeiB
MTSGVSTFTLGSVAAGTQSLPELFAGRLQSWPYVVITGVIMVVPAVVLGIWAGRRRYLDEPARHRRFLVRATVITMLVSVCGSVPAGLIQTGIWARPSGSVLWVAAFVQPLTGFLGGIGLAALVALVSLRYGSRPGRLATAVQALGQRSLTLYLFQSVVFVAVFHPSGLGLQDDLGLAGATGVAAATWLVSLALAEVLRREGHRGPVETLLRRLTYGRPSADGPA